jgi:hypothetical protein
MLINDYNKFYIIMPWLHFGGVVYDFFAATHNTKKESNTRLTACKLNRSNHCMMSKQIKIFLNIYVIPKMQCTTL